MQVSRRICSVFLQNCRKSQRSLANQLNRRFASENDKEKTNASEKDAAAGKSGENPADEIAQVFQ
jgi:hypothetical protein